MNNSTVTCNINNCSISSGDRARPKTIAPAIAKTANPCCIDRTKKLRVKSKHIGELESNYWQELEQFNDKADRYLNQLDSAIAKWDDYRLWENFPADPTRNEVPIKRIVIDRRRQIKPINAQCSLSSEVLVVGEESENNLDEEPSSCSNLIFHFYQQLKQIS